MKQHVAWLGLLASVLAVGAPALRAQSSGDSLATAIRAYRNLEFEAAARLLRREVTRLSARRAPDTTVTRALVYLGAADLFRGQRDSAAAVFRRLLILDPGFRPSGLIFPPEVTAAFEGVRRETRSVVIAAPRDTVIILGGGSFAARLLATSFHTVEVTLRYEDGFPFRSLYYGPIADSLSVTWDGLDPTGNPPAVERLLLRVASHSPTGELVGVQQLPLQVRVVRADTLPWPTQPADSQFLPERSGSGPAKRALTGGLLLSAAVVSLPTIVGGTETSSGPRLAVAGSVGLAGLVGYFLHRPGRPLEANIRANHAVRETWQQRLATVQADNTRRVGDVRLAIRAGEPTSLQPRRP